MIDINGNIKDISLGNIGIKNVYVGSELVYQKSGITPVLPYDAEIEYLESTGSQYIDLGAKATLYTTIELDFYCMDSSARIFGSRETWKSKAFVLSFTSGTDSRLSFNYANLSNTDNIVFDVYCDDGNWHKVISNGRGHRQIDNIIKAGTFSNFTTPNNIILFGYNDNGTIRYGNIRIRSCKFNSLDLIPVRVGTTGYMYDKVSGQLFGNSGTNNFILGNDIT